MQHSLGIADEINDRNGIANIADLDADALAMPGFQPLCILAHAAAREIVEDRYGLTAGSEPIGKIAADEAASAGNEYGASVGGHVHHATNPRRSNSSVAFS